ncbi:ketoacyl-ACP synthase III [Roseospira marina]|uniref:Beta-ketoacyl-[acyl-carrier-protein] synthase III n=1 Tax=Roseospira marina TaxID=140057 RepID=A0A5M6IGW3_9PROT|nr:beta-ketoacyl-ACP synthase III [Roseospira marina]KAA5607523.1 ketoacyl-ACP synthase III [Roseospira marina]MBB4312292.1 3-oxoacyl-[acyl-carrier-protein] synthase-3 [Roseospira marina]MBB5085692.1 3-oxoacyl-[acyl-carrier-protein] synthase-3 [Roseospira marina]
MVTRSVLLGTGSRLPERVVTNDDMARIVDTSDAWIRDRSGIRERRFAAEGETTSDLAIAAGRAALERADLDGKDVDLIILATATPDHTFPATATKVQAALGAEGCIAFDMQAVCTGFIYALTTADSFLRAGQARTALVIGAETFSRILDWTDRGTCVLFGDGAGAVVLRAETGTGDARTDRGILSCHLHADGRQHHLLYVDGGPSTTQTTGLVRMQGREVFRHAVANMAQVVDEALTATGLTGSDLDWLVPHQANQRIIEATARKVGLSMDKVVMTVARHANTSAASVPLALDEAVRDGRIRPGHLALLEGMGGGFTWGSALLRL